MFYRIATSEDVAALVVVRLAVTENRLSDPSRITIAMCQDYLNHLGRGWVCEVEGQIVGFSVAARADYSIWALFLLPEFEGRGIGKRLLQYATDWLFALGAPHIQLSTTANTRADTFYTLQGWHRGEMKDAIEVCYTLPRPVASATNLP